MAGQRAGTTALHSALGSTGALLTFKEIFHTDPAESAASFLNFSRQKDLRLADMATEKGARQIAVEYLEHLREVAGNKIPLLDIKLNSWHVIKPFWSYVHEMPFFMKVLLQQQTLFLFIRRRSLVDQLVSEQIARSIDKWHNLEQQDVPGQFRINAIQMANQARLTLQSEAFLLMSLGRQGSLITIEYEDLYPDGFVNPRLLQTLQEKLGVTLPRSLKPSITKNVPEKRSVVSNFDEVSSTVNEVLRLYPRPKLMGQII